MTNPTSRIESAVYKRLQGHPDGETLDELARLYEVNRSLIAGVVDSMQARGLVSNDDLRVTALCWRASSHWLVRMEIPHVSQQIFEEYSQDLEDLCHQLREDGIVALRPPVSEVELVIATATFVGGVLAKSLITSLGNRVAEFVGKVVRRRRSQGIDNITIKGQIHVSDDNDIEFTISGQNAQSVADAFDKLRQRLDSSDS